MPGEKDGLILDSNGMQYVGQPTPYGFALAMLALQFGISKIAIVSIGEWGCHRHAHPIYWAADRFNGEVVDGRLWVFTSRGYASSGIKDLPIKDWVGVLNIITK